MPGPRKKIDKAAWKQQRRHEVTLPSGFSVIVEIPNLSALVKSGYLPNDLVQQALKTVQDGNISAEAVGNQSEFYTKLLTKMVKEPELVEEDVVGDDAIPFEDVEMLVELATRQRDIDALGNHIGGLHTSKQWRTFRGLEHLYEDVADV